MKYLAFILLSCMTYNISTILRRTKYDCSHVAGKGLKQKNGYVACDPNQEKIDNLTNNLVTYYLKKDKSIVDSIAGNVDKAHLSIFRFHLFNIKKPHLKKLDLPITDFSIHFLDIHHETYTERWEVKLKTEIEPITVTVVATDIFRLTAYGLFNFRFEVLNRIGGGKTHLNQNGLLRPNLFSQNFVALKQLKAFIIKGNENLLQKFIELLTFLKEMKILPTIDDIDDLSITDLLETMILINDQEKINQLYYIQLPNQYVLIKGTIDKCEEDINCIDLTLKQYRELGVHIIFVPDQNLIKFIKNMRNMAEFESILKAINNNGYDFIQNKFVSIFAEHLITLKSFMSNKIQIMLDSFGTLDDWFKIHDYLVKILSVDDGDENPISILKSLDLAAHDDPTYLLDYEHNYKRYLKRYFVQPFLEQTMIFK
jgi:hypothetical protein